MSLNKELNRESLRFFYEENKEFSVPIFAIISSIILFFVFLIPQLTSLSTQKSERGIEFKKLDQLNNAKKAIEDADRTLVESQLKNAARALPTGKDFEGILNSVSYAADASGVQIENYNFVLGKLSENEVTETAKMPTLTFNLSLAATPDQIVSYVDKLYSNLPIAEIKTISSTESQSNLDILFYYKPFPSAESVDRASIRNMNENEKSALDFISDSGNTVPTEQINETFEVSTDSANSSPF